MRETVFDTGGSGPIVCGSESLPAEMWRMREGSERLLRLALGFEPSEPATTTQVETTAIPKVNEISVKLLYRRPRNR